MKSENIVLTVCLVFAISVITCLSVQSCKSHQFRRNISLEIDRKWITAFGEHWRRLL